MARSVPAPPTDVAAVVKAPIAARGRNGAAVIGRAAAVPGTPWRVWVELDQATLLAPMQRLEKRFAAAGLLVLALAAAAAWLLSRSVTRPILEMTRTAEAMAGGDFSRRVEEVGSGELGRLAANAGLREVAVANDDGGQLLTALT